jgi:hypothetical protein
MTGAIAWSGHILTIPLSLAAGVLLYQAESRLQAFTALFFYYLAASWPIIPGAKSFFGTRASTIDGILLWLSAATILALPSLLLFTRDPRNRPLAVVGIFVLTAIPPLGIIGWASPLLAAGVLFPGTEWFGLIATLGTVALIGRSPLRIAAFTAMLAVVVNASYKPPAVPPGWRAVNTEFGGAGQGEPDFLAEFDAHEQMQETIRQSNARVLLFPEHVVTQWNEATEVFWRQTLESLTRRHATILIGAGLPRPDGIRLGGGRYFNVLIAKSQVTQAVYYQRIPVPIGMWKPLSGNGAPLNVFGNGTIDIQHERAAVLLCYEQLLVWPFVSSAFEHPTVLITAANDYWAKQTPIPEIQKASVRSFTRLFGLPLLSAVNQ